MTEEASIDALVGSRAPQPRSRFDVSTDDLKQRALRGGLAKVGAQGGLFILRIGSVMVLARILNPSDFGLVNMVTVVTGLFALFRDAGLSMVTVQRATISDAQVSGLFWLNMALGAMLTVLSIGLAPALVAFYREPRLFWVAVAIGSGFLFSAAGVQHTALLQRHMRFTTLAVVDTVSSVVAVVVGVSMALLGFRYWALVGMAVSQPIVSSAGAWACAGWTPGLPRRGVGLLSMVRFGGFVTLNGLLMYVGCNTDKLLLGRFAGATTLGLYGRAYQLLSVPIDVLQQAVSGVALSVLSRLQADAGRLATYFLKGYAVFVAATLPITVACSLFASDIIYVLLGRKWGAAAPLLRCLSPTVVAFAMIYPVGWLVFATGKVERGLKMACVMAPLLVAACSIGLAFGAVGVAIGFSTTMVTLIAPLVVWGIHGSAVRPRQVASTVKAPVVAALLATAVTLPAVFRFGGPLSPLSRLVCEGALFSASYVWVLLYPMRQRDFYIGLLQDLRGRR